VTPLSTPRNFFEGAWKALLSLGALVALFWVLPACTPSLHPLYQDYEVKPHSASTQERLQKALIDSGWTLKSSTIPGIVTTDNRQVRQWGLYAIVVSLEAVPIGGGHVRLLLHPYREYVWGTRSKIPFLNGSIRRSVLRDLDAAMSAQALTAVGTGISRDRGTTR